MGKHIKQLQQELTEDWHKDAHPLFKNADGTPKTFYHGTTHEFDHFKDNEAGHFFSEHPRRAAEYAHHLVFNGVDGPAGVNVRPVHLNVKNPFIANAKSIREVAKTLGHKDPDQFLADFEDSGFSERRAVVKHAKDNGHDGMVISRDLMPVHVGGDWGFMRSFVAFHPHQIKSVFSESREPARDAWHADSHPLMKNEDGSPKTYFHGTNRDFDKFDGGSEVAGYFTPHPHIASDHAENLAAPDAAEPRGHASVMPVHLHIKNPVVLDGDTSSYIGYEPEEIRRLKSLGHDGIVSDDGHEVIAFHPHQIKSVFASKFDPKSKNISEDREISESAKDAAIPSIEDLEDHKDDSECYDHSYDVVSRWPHLQLDAGYYMHKDGAMDHGWAIHPNGTIIDTTSSQFSKNAPMIVPPDHPHYGRYVSFSRHPEKSLEISKQNGWSEDQHNRWKKRVLGESFFTKDDARAAFHEAYPDGWRMEKNPTGETPWKNDVHSDHRIVFVDGDRKAIVWGNHIPDANRFEVEYAHVYGGEGRGTYTQLLGKLQKHMSVVSDLPHQNAAKGIYQRLGARELRDGRFILDHKPSISESLDRTSEEYSMSKLTLTEAENKKKQAELLEAVKDKPLLEQIDTLTASGLFQLDESYFDDKLASPFAMDRLYIATHGTDAHRDQLLKDEDAMVRFGVAQKGHLTQLSQLAQDPNAMVRDMVARRGDQALAQTMTQDQHAGVRSSAFNRLAELSAKEEEAKQEMAEAAKEPPHYKKDTEIQLVQDGRFAKVKAWFESKKQGVFYVVGFPDGKTDMLQESAVRAVNPEEELQEGAKEDNDRANAERAAARMGKGIEKMMHVQRHISNADEAAKRGDMTAAAEHIRLARASLQEETVMERHADTEWAIHRDMAGTNHDDGPKHDMSKPYKLKKKDGSLHSTHDSEKEAMHAYSSEKDNKGMKIVKESFFGEKKLGKVFKDHLDKMHASLDAGDVETAKSHLRNLELAAGGAIYLSPEGAKHLDKNGVPYMYEAVEYDAAELLEALEAKKNALHKLATDHLAASSDGARKQVEDKIHKEHGPKALDSVRKATKSTEDGSPSHHWAQHVAHAQDASMMHEDFSMADVGLSLDPSQLDPVDAQMTFANECPFCAEPDAEHSNEEHQAAMNYHTIAAKAGKTLEEKHHHSRLFMRHQAKLKDL